MLMGEAPVLVGERLRFIQCLLAMLMLETVPPDARISGGGRGIMRSRSRWVNFWRVGEGADGLVNPRHRRKPAVGRVELKVVSPTSWPRSAESLRRPPPRTPVDSPVFQLPVSNLRVAECNPPAHLL